MESSRSKIVVEIISLLLIIIKKCKLTANQISRSKFSLCFPAEPHVIGSSQPIIAVLGDDVILPCHVDPRLNVEELTVEWWRPDLPPDPGDPLSQYKYVHRYHDHQDAEDTKMSSYAGRTALVAGGLKHGNVSLKIRNVKLSDQGWYRCVIKQLGRYSDMKLDVGNKICYN